MTCGPIRDGIRKKGPLPDHKIAALDFKQLPTSIRLRKSKIESAPPKTDFPFDGDSVLEWSKHPIYQVFRHQSIWQLGIDAHPSALMPDKHQCCVGSAGPGIRRHMNQQFCSGCQ